MTLISGYEQQQSGAFIAAKVPVSLSPCPVYVKGDNTDQVQLLELPLAEASPPQLSLVNPLPGSCQQVIFLLLPGSSMAAVSEAIGVLQSANQLAGSRLYQWSFCSEDGLPVALEEGFQLGVQQSFVNLPVYQFDKLIVCGGQGCTDTRLLRRLRQADAVVQIGSLGLGCYPLARAGLLDNYRCTSHWQHLAALQEEFPELLISSQLYVIDGKRFTCAGKRDVTDLWLHLLEQDQGAALAAEVADMLVCSGRLSSEPQRGFHNRSRPGYMPSVLQDAVALMEANIEEPLTLQEIAGLLVVSRRQVERLFSKYLDCQPSRYYMELRLNRGRDLLHKTSKSITEISIACGFSSASHFSKNMKDQFGCSPKALSRQMKDVSGSL